MARPSSIRAVLTLCMLALSMPGRAEVAPLTPATAQQMIDMATDARSANPHSHDGAYKRFFADFKRVFGNLNPPRLTFQQRPALVVWTPLGIARNEIIRALRQNSPLPNVESLTRVHVVDVSLAGGPIGMPFVLEVAVFRDGSAIQPTKSTLERQAVHVMPPGQTDVESYTLNSGTVEFPIEAFAAGAPVKIVCTTSRGHVELALSASDVAKLR